MFEMKTRPFSLFVFFTILALLTPGKVHSAIVQAGSFPSVALASAPDAALVSAALRSAPAMFIENAGQFAEGARFQMHGGNATIWLAEDAIWITVLEKPSSLQPSSPAPIAPPNPSALWSSLGGMGRQAGHEDDSRRGVHLKLSFPGANPHPHLESFDRLETHVSYFISNDPAKWHPDVPVWGGVRYKDLYPGIDLEVASEGGQMVQRLICSANCQFALRQVRLQVDGADGMTLAGEGLRLTTPLGEYTLPLLQLTGISSTDLTPPTLSGKQLSSPFQSATLGERSRTLQSTRAEITNSQSNGLLYATYLGGSFDEWGGDIAVASSGAAYVTGDTGSYDFPTTPGAFDTSYNYGLDAFVVKLNPAGSALDYATFLGGSDYELRLSIAIDSSGAAYVTGETRSSDFPTTPGAFDTSFNGGIYDTDAFVVKLNPAGSALIYATYLGGNADDWSGDIAIDLSGAAYVTGGTWSSDFPTTAGAFDTSHNGGDGDIFIAKLDSAGSTLIYATFLGGSGDDGGSGIVIDLSGAAYITGYTDSSDFPTTPGAFDPTYNDSGGDAFVVKLNPAGSALTYATFLGGSDDDNGRSIAIDSSEAAYITGMTSSSDFPTTPGAFDTTHDGNASDAFVAKLNPAGSALSYATFLGGSDKEYSGDIAIDASRAAYVTGWTQSSDFPTTPDAFDTTRSGDTCGTEPYIYPCYDAFVVELNSAGSALSYATYLGGSDDDWTGDIAVNLSGEVYVTGTTSSSDFPTTPGAFDTSCNGDCWDTFIVKLDLAIHLDHHLYLPLARRD